eukprot:229137-Rhodomonas_salina.1
MQYRFKLFYNGSFGVCWHADRVKELETKLNTTLQVQIYSAKSNTILVLACGTDVRVSLYERVVLSSGIASTNRLVPVLQSGTELTTRTTVGTELGGRRSVTRCSRSPTSARLGLALTLDPRPQTLDPRP